MKPPVYPMTPTNPFKKWELRVCATKGHLTYEPTGPGAADLAPRLRAETSRGEAWRCLRCGDFTLGPPTLRAPVAEVPHINRGKAIRQAFILRLLGAERFLRGIGLLMIAYAVYRFHGAQGGFQAIFDRSFPAVQALAANFNYDVNASAIVSLIHKSLTLSGATLTWVATGVALYGLIGMVEGIGLLLLKRWGEYFAAVATSAFIPFEIYEVLDKVTVIKAGALILNLAALAYLVYTKRLFGARGGARAYEQELRSEALLDLELAAGTTAPQPPLVG